MLLGGRRVLGDLPPTNQKETGISYRTKETHSFSPPPLIVSKIMMSFSISNALFATALTVAVAILFNQNLTQTLEYKQKDLGFIELFASQDPVVDIVAIHGLDGHREESWTAEDGTMWLRDLLPNDFPNARILTYGYDANTRSFAQMSTQNIFRHAEAFAEDLSTLRRKHSQRPIIFLAHSLGGIILKRALVICHGDDLEAERNLRDIPASTIAILFFGTPHSGANGVQLAEWMGRLLSVYMYTNNQVLKDLDRDSSELENIQRLYFAASKRVNTIFFYEEYRTPTLGGLRELIVPRHLAVIQGDSKARVAVLHANHCEMVKFTGKGDHNYQKVVDYISELMEKAPTKIQENWIRENEYRSIAKRQSSLASKPSVPKPRIPVSRSYIRRPHLHSFLTRKLLPISRPEQQPRCILHGLGGGGKTQLAAFWIEENQDKFNRVIVIDASSQQQVEADLETVIRSIGPQYIKATWKDAVNYLSSERGWLLFFDNADEPDLRLDEYLPNSIHGAVLVTTRNRGCIAYAPDSHIQVGQLKENEAIDLLHKVADITPSSKDATLAIVKELGMWALAITQAGVYIFKTRSLDTYLAIFQKHREKMMREASLKGRNYQGSTYTAFDLSFGLLPQRAKDLMKICAFLHYSSIPQALFEQSIVSGFRAYKVIESLPPPRGDDTTILGLKDIFGSEWDPFTFQTLVDSVARRSLLDSFTNDDGEASYSIHPLLQTYIKDSLDQKSHDHYALLASQLLLGAIRPLEGNSNAWHRQMVSHVDNMPMDIKLAHISHTLSFLMVYKSTGDCHASQTLWEYCYSQSGRILGPRHSDTITVMNSLAATLHDCGQLKEAKEIKRDVLSLRSEVLGPWHPKTISAMGSLAFTLQYCGELGEAEVMQRDALVLQMKILGLRHPKTMIAMANLAITLQHRGKMEEAEGMQRKVLALQTEVLGPRHPDTIMTKDTLSHIIHDRGQLEEAENLQREVLELQMKILGHRHPNIIIATSRLGTTLHSRGKLEEAERMHRYALALSTEILGSRHPYTIAATSSLAYTLYGRYPEEAEKLQRESLELRTVILGPQHPNTIITMHNLATILHSRGKRKEAGKMRRDAMMLQTDTLDRGILTQQGHSTSTHSTPDRERGT